MLPVVGFISRVRTPHIPDTEIQESRAVAGNPRDAAVIFDP